MPSLLGNRRSQENRLGKETETLVLALLSILEAKEISECHDKEWALRIL